MTINYPKVSEREFLLKYLDFLNLLLPEERKLVPSEIDLVIEFALLPPKFQYQRFGTLAKSKVIESASSLGWKLTKLNINNKLYALLGKEFLRRDEDQVIYLPDHLLKALNTFRTKNLFEFKINFSRNEDIEDRSSSVTGS